MDFELEYINFSLFHCVSYVPTMLSNVGATGKVTNNELHSYDMKFNSIIF